MTEQKCPAMHNPGVWPYVSRCVLTGAHEEHQDRNGVTWRDDGADAVDSSGVRPQ